MPTPLTQPSHHTLLPTLPITARGHPRAWAPGWWPQDQMLLSEIESQGLQEMVPHHHAPRPWLLDFLINTQPLCTK